MPARGSKSPKKKTGSPSKKKTSSAAAPLPASSLGRLAASTLQPPLHLSPPPLADSSLKAEKAFAAMEERRRLFRRTEGWTEIHGDSGIAAELDVWAKARAQREEATEARIEAMHYAWTASRPGSRPGSGSHRPPLGGRSAYTGALTSSNLSVGRLRPGSAPVGSRLRPSSASSAGRLRPVSAAARSYRKEPTAWRLHVTDVSVSGLIELVRMERESAPAPRAQRLGFGSSSIARTAPPGRPASKPAPAASGPAELRVVVRALWSNERALTAPLPPAGDKLTWRGVGVALSLPAMSRQAASKTDGAQQGGAQGSRPSGAKLGGSWANGAAEGECVSVELWGVRQAGIAVEETLLASAQASLPIGGRSQPEYAGDATLQLQYARDANDARVSRAASDAPGAVNVSFSWRAEGQTRRQVEQEWSDGEGRADYLSEEDSDDSAFSSSGDEEDDLVESASVGSTLSRCGSTAINPGGRDSPKPSAGDADDLADDEHPLAGLTMAGMGVAKVWDAEAGRWKRADTAGAADDGGAGVGSFGGGSRRDNAVVARPKAHALGSVARGEVPPTVYDTPATSRLVGGGGVPELDVGTSSFVGGQYITQLAQPPGSAAHPPPVGSAASSRASSKSVPPKRPATAGATARAARSRSGAAKPTGRKGAAAPAAHPPPPVDPEAARFRNRPSSAPSARLLTGLDELSRIKAAFERKGLEVNMRPFERGLLTPEDRPAEVCLRALPRQGSRAMPLDRFLPPHLRPEPKPTKKKGVKGKKVKKK